MTKNKFTVKRGEEAKESAPRGRDVPVKETPEDDEALKARERKEFENEKKSYLEEKLEFHAKKALSEEGLPVSFSKLLCGESEEETLENIALFKEEFLKTVEAELSKKLKGSTPKTVSDMETFDSFLNGFGN